MSLSLKQVGMFARLSRPFFLLGGALLYGLGVSVARYLGQPIDAASYLLGQALVTLLQMMTQYLNEYFDHPGDAENLNRTPLTGGSGVLGEDGLPRKVALYSAIVSVTLAGSLATAALIGGRLPLSAGILLTLGFLGGLLYSVPPVRLVASGYGELVAALVVSGLVPSFAYAMQTGGVHRFIPMTVTPLIALQFAMLLAFELPDYGSDLKHDKRTLMVRLGWSTGMRMHDIALLLAAVSIVIAYINGLPTRVVLGTAIALPLAIAQTWQMWRIRSGYAPNWRLLTYSALGLFALVAYLELVGYLLS